MKTYTAIVEHDKETGLGIASWNIKQYFEKDRTQDKTAGVRM